jgi:hypothetical protein
VIFPPGFAKLATMPSATGSPPLGCHYDRDRRRGPLESHYGSRVAGDNCVNFEANQLGGKVRKLIGLVFGKSRLDENAPALDIAKISQPLQKCLAGGGLRISSEPADPRDLLRLLRLSWKVKRQEYSA